MGIRKPEQPKIIWLISWWNGNWSLYVPLCLWFCYSHLTCVKFIPLPLCRLHVDKEDHREPSKWGGKRHGGEKNNKKNKTRRLISYLILTSAGQFVTMPFSLWYLHLWTDVKVKFMEIWGTLPFYVVAVSGYSLLLQSQSAHCWTKPRRTAARKTSQTQPSRHWCGLGWNRHTRMLDFKQDRSRGKKWSPYSCKDYCKLQFAFVGGLFGWNGRINI